MLTKDIMFIADFVNVQRGLVNLLTGLAMVAMKFEVNLSMFTAG